MVLDHLQDVGERLQLFKEYVQVPKQPYFDAIRDSKLNVSDRIIALDTSVGAMHIEFSSERRYAYQESADLRKALERARFNYSDSLFQTEEKESDLVICRGIPASPGIATGRARIIVRNSEYKRLPFGSIVVAKMTRPEVVFGLENIAAIVTDIGGSLCHAAIICREMGIPCVAGTGNATQVIENSKYISVDGDSGIISRK